MRTRLVAWCLLVSGIFVTRTAAGQEHASSLAAQQKPPGIAHAEVHPAGPPVTLADVVQEALQKNPELIALRRQTEAVRARSGQERFLNAPVVEAQIWQWPINA